MSNVEFRQPTQVSRRLSRHGKFRHIAPFDASLPVEDICDSVLDDVATPQSRAAARLRNGCAIDFDDDDAESASDLSRTSSRSKFSQSSKSSAPFRCQSFEGGRPKQRPEFGEGAVPPLVWLRRGESREEESEQSSPQSHSSIGSSTCKPAAGACEELPHFEKAELSQDCLLEVVHAVDSRLALGSWTAARIRGGCPGEKNCSAQPCQIDEGLLSLICGDPACFQRVLADSKQPCNRKQATCRSVALLAEGGFIEDLVVSNIFAPLSRQLKCSDDMCRFSALKAIDALLSSVTPAIASANSCANPTKGRLRAFLSGGKSFKGSQDASVTSKFMVDAKGGKRLVKLLTSGSETISNTLLVLNMLRSVAMRHAGAAQLPARDIYYAAIELVMQHVLSIENGPSSAPGAPSLDDSMAIISASLHMLGALLVLPGEPCRVVGEDLKLDLIMQLLNSPVPAVVDAAAELLVELAGVSDKLKMSIALNGGLEAITEQLSSPKPPSSVLELLCVLANYEPVATNLVTTGVITLLLDALRWRNGRPREAALAARVLLQLSVFSRQCRVTIVAAQGLMELMRWVASDVESTQLVAAAALLAVMLDSVANQGAAVKLGIDQEVRRLLNQPHRVSDPFCRDLLVFLLVVLRKA